MIKYPKKTKPCEYICTIHKYHYTYICVYVYIFYISILTYLGSRKVAET